MTIYNCYTTMLVSNWIWPLANLGRTRWRACEPNATWLPAMSMSTSVGFVLFMVLLFRFTSYKNYWYKREIIFDPFCAIFSDALDSMNNKLAIQLADKILRKQKDLYCAKVKVSADGMNHVQWKCDDAKCVVTGYTQSFVWIAGS